MATQWATVTDITRRHYAPVPDSRLGWVESLIEDAEGVLTDVIPTLADRVDSGDVPAARVERIVAAAVLRVMRNPEGLTQFARTTGPYTSSGSRPAASALAEVWFRPDEIDSLRPADTASAVVRSARLALPRWRIPHDDCAPPRREGWEPV